MDGFEDSTSSIEAIKKEQHRKKIIVQLAYLNGIPKCQVCGVVYWHRVDNETIQIDGCDCKEKKNNDI
jgi:hypothetical protein